jgi:integrase
MRSPTENYLGIRQKPDSEFSGTPSPIGKDYIRAAGRKAKLEKDIGWHTFRHAYRSFLDDAGAPVGVQQKLMRHAQVSTTMNTYGNAQMPFKRSANTKVVQTVLPSKGRLEEAG